MTEKLNKISEIEVQILKMNESSGNELFFVRLIRTDNKKEGLFNQVHLDYSCWQTKDLSKTEALERAWFDASFLARFIGLKSMEDVQIHRLNDEEIKILKNSLSIYHD